MSDLRLTEEEILAEAQLNWTDGDGSRFSFAKRIETALLKKVAEAMGGDRQEDAELRIWIGQLRAAAGEGK